MLVQMKNISGHQSAKVMAIYFAVMTSPLALVGLIGFFSGASMTTDEGVEFNFPWLFFILAPFIYGAIGYLFNRLFIWIYNLIASRFGGLEFHLEEQGGT